MLHAGSATWAPAVPKGQNATAIISRNEYATDNENSKKLITVAVACCGLARPMPLQHASLGFQEPISTAQQRAGGAGGRDQPITHQWQLTARRLEFFLLPHPARAACTLFAGCSPVP